MTDRDILPNYFKPVHYDLVLSDLDFGKWAYKGSVTIEGELVRPTREIVLNVLDLKLLAASVTVAQNKGSQTRECTGFSEDKRLQRATIAFADELPVSPKASLKVDFTGEINHDMAGFYRSQYKPPVPAAASVARDEQFHYTLNTQFQACDARRAFPCLDEPNLKATFDIAIEIPDDQVALSNMPVKEVRGTAEQGKTLVAFDRTPVMSTYLVAWAVGDFKYVEAFTERRYNGKQLPVRVYAVSGLEQKGRWALEQAPKTIDFFSAQFGIDYPLPKVDILAVHEFTHGAMENWGLTTYRMSAILFDEELSDVAFRIRIAYIVAHELAHQWFGDLVTMDWWDELWLNEGFATWAGWIATDHLHPEWEVWSQCVHEGMGNAFRLDAVRASHPIQVVVRDALEVNQIFDNISYLKGCSMIRMLASNIGTQTFLKGVAIYLRKHAYGNAKTEDLWTAVSEASGTDVNTIMRPWIEKIGFPVLTVTESPQSIMVKQSRFLSSGDVGPEDDKTIWWLPLALRGRAGASEIESLELTEKETTISGVNEDFYQLNAGATGFYLVNYPASRLATLGTQLDRLSPEDKIFITGAAADLAASGDASTTALLAFVLGMKGETSYRVLAQAIDSIDNIKSIFGDDPRIKEGLEKFTLVLIDKTLDRLGWQAAEGEDLNTDLLRKRVLLTAVSNGHEGTIQHGTKLFADYLADPQASPIPGLLRAPVYRAALRTDPVHTVAALKKEWASTLAIDGKETILAALGDASDPGLVKEALLPFLFNTSPPAPASETILPGDVHHFANSLAGNPATRSLLWDHMRENWSQLTAKLGGNLIVLNRMVLFSLRQLTSLDRLAEIDSFFGGVDTRGFDRSLLEAKDRIRSRAAYRARDAAGLREWLEANGY